MNKTLELAMELIRRPSITPHDHGCQELLGARLALLGFHLERLKFGEVENLWARRGTTAPLVVFAGHTDVVPPGPRKDWSGDPFMPELRDGFLYGRGAADMKSSLAAFVTAIEDFVAANPGHRGSIGVLLTADEEGPSVDGTAKVMGWLNARGERIDYCIVGEPTCTDTLGDVIKIGRRGSLNGRLVVHGTQGHVAYAHLAKNPVHSVAPALAELVATEWDRGTPDFPPTTFQISNVHGGAGVDNVIPGALEIRFNFRFSPAVGAPGLRARVEDVLARHGVDHDLDWTLCGETYLTRGTILRAAIGRAIHETVGIDTRALTDGGTSDGRFIAPSGAEVVEFGPINSTIHKVDERIASADLEKLSTIYRNSIHNLLGISSK